MIVLQPPGEVIIDAQNKSRVFELTSGAKTLALSGLTLTNGATNADGGGIYSPDSTLYLASCTVTLSDADDNGGGIYAKEAHLAGSCSIGQNTAGADGGGLFISEMLQVNDIWGIPSVDVIIDGNSADGSGGGIALDDATAEIYNKCKVYSNHAGTDGGGISAVGSELFREFNVPTSYGSVQISGNTADGDGGGISFDSTSYIEMDRWWLTGNSAAGLGGAISYKDSGRTSPDLFWDRLLVESNSATFGGGFAFDDCQFDSINVQPIWRSTLDDNHAADSGGAVYLSSTSGAFEFDQCTIENNFATTGSGGGMFIDRLYDDPNPAVTIKNSLIATNSAVIYGGGLCYPHGVVHDDITNIRNSTIYWNTAMTGGGVAIIGDGTSDNSPKIYNSTIARNIATGDPNALPLPDPGDGGGVYLASFNANETLLLDSTIVAVNEGYSTSGPDVYGETVTGHRSGIGVDDGFTHDGTQLPSFISDNHLGNATVHWDPEFATSSGTTIWLADNGGLTRTIALKPGGASIDEGEDSLTLGSDQRHGSKRVYGKEADIGAFEFQAPGVLEVIFGDGTNQRSLVKQIVINFTEPVDFSGDVTAAITLSRSGSGSPTGSVDLAASPATGTAISSVTITFSGALTEYDSLIDGLYDFSIDDDQVSSAGGKLDGDSNGTAGGDYTVNGSIGNQYFRIFGDADGDGTVTLTDFAAFQAVYNLGPNPIFDFDNSGNVTLYDFGKFQQRFNLSP